MAGKRVVLPREKDIPLETLLSGVGLTVPEWTTYLAILEQPAVSAEDLPHGSPETFESLAERGLLRPSVERALGYAPIPPGTAFSKLMGRYDDGLIQDMRAGMELRKLLREVSEASRSAPSDAGSGAGIEVYTDLNEARDRIYDLAALSQHRRHYLLEPWGRRPKEGDELIKRLAEARQSARGVDDMLMNYDLCTYVLDQDSAFDPAFAVEAEKCQANGETVLQFPGRLPQLLLREGSHLVMWRDPMPSRAATVIVTTPWALDLALNYVRLVVALSQPWRGPSSATNAPASREIPNLLSRGLTDDQIALRLGLSPRTVGRHVAALLEDLGAETRFQAGVLLERRRNAALQAEKT